MFTRQEEPHCHSRCSADEVSFIINPGFLGSLGTHPADSAGQTRSPWWWIDTGQVQKQHMSLLATFQWLGSFHSDPSGRRLGNTESLCAQEQKEMASLCHTHQNTQRTGNSYQLSSTTVSPLFLSLSLAPSAHAGQTGLLVTHSTAHTTPPGCHTPARLSSVTVHFETDDHLQIYF